MCNCWCKHMCLKWKIKERTRQLISNTWRVTTEKRAEIYSPLFFEPEWELLGENYRKTALTQDLYCYANPCWKTLGCLGTFLVLNFNLSIRGIYVEREICVGVQINNLFKKTMCTVSNLLSNNKERQEFFLLEAYSLFRNADRWAGNPGTHRVRRAGAGKVQEPTVVAAQGYREA